MSLVIPEGYVLLLFKEDCILKRLPDSLSLKIAGLFEAEASGPWAICALVFVFLAFLGAHFLGTFA